MAFGFNQPTASPQASVTVGAEVTEINPETLGFSSLGYGLEGPKKVKLLPSAWPSDNVPPASATLLSIASRRGLLAAASPDTLVLASTENVRKAFKKEAGTNDLVTDFSPDATLSVPQLRHVVFSAGEDFLVVSAESGGGLAVYGVDNLLKGEKEPGLQIPTNGAAVRALLPNPVLEQYMAVVSDSGRLDIVDVATAETRSVRNEGVACASWSVKGKAFVVGLNDGTAAIYMASTLEERGRVPRPPEAGEGYSVSGVFWLSNEEFFIIHSLPDSTDEDGMQEDALYHFVSTNNAYNEFTFRKAPYALVFPAMDAPPRKPPPRFSVQRLRKWEPILNDMLIVTAADSTDVAVLTHTSESIDTHASASEFNEFQNAALDDSRKATVPRNLADDGDSVLIGEALDLSSKENVQEPSRRLGEITESPTPLPAYFLLTHEGLLAAWWVVWDKALEAGTAYHGLTCNGQETGPTTPAKPTPQEPKPASTFGQPSTGPSSSLLGNGKPATSFGTPSTPKFGSTAFPSTTPAFGQPSQPAFGSTTSMGAAATPAFGTTGLGKKQSPWGSVSQTSATTQPPANPFAAAAASGQTGFAKFGGTGSGASAFSSFSSSKEGQSGFGALGQQKSAFAGSSNALGNSKSETSFGSTVTVDSKLTGTGSTLPSWANTPAQQGNSIFGQPASSSFPSFTSTQSASTDADDARNRERDEATPTPQVPSQQKNGLFGLPTGGFKLNSTFKGDESAKEDGTKPQSPSGGALFGNAFTSALGSTISEPPATPTKSDADKALQDDSTTPATVPRPTNSLFSGTISSTPRATPPKETVTDDAPLPPDFMTSKPSKTDDDIPPFAGSPPVNVEAPSSSVLSSPLDEDDEELEEEDGDEVEDDISVEEEQDGDEKTEEASPSDTARRLRKSGPEWSFQNSVNQSPTVFPAAPTPPHRGRTGSPALPPTFGQPSRSNSSPFGQPVPAGQSVKLGGFSKSPLSFAPVYRTQGQFRSSSTARAASTSSRDSLAAPASSLGGSVQQQRRQQQSKSATPPPQFSDLIDDEDERIRRELASAIEPSRILDPFLARQEYNEAALGKTGHAAQIEIIYRDINSMVDTLGLNCRSLRAFVEYHDRSQRHTKLTRSDLEEVLGQGDDQTWFEKWSFAGMADLKTLEDQLEQELDEGRAKHVVDKLDRLLRLNREVSKVTSNVNDERRRIIHSKEPDKIEALRKISLPKELADQQKVLRREYAQLLTSLGKAEDAIILLRSKLLSRSAEKGRTDMVPSVDAIKKTINKLITITKEKNNEITLLESQFRKVGLADPSRPSSSSSRQAATPSRRSRAARHESPLATPPTTKSKMSLMELNRTALTPGPETPNKGYGLYYTPDGSPSARRDFSGLADKVGGDLDKLKETAKRRRNIARSLASALVERGIKTTEVSGLDG